MAVGLEWSQFTSRLQQSSLAQQRLLVMLLNGPEKEFYADLIDRLVETDPHAIYPTSSYRQSAGFVVSTPDDQVVEAVMTHSTFTSIRVLETCSTLRKPFCETCTSPPVAAFAWLTKMWSTFTANRLNITSTATAFSLDKLVLSRYGSGQRHPHRRADAGGL